MSYRFRQLDPKTRCLVAIGNFGLAVGLILLITLHPASQFERNCLHAICGFFLGFSVVINLCALTGAGRCKSLRNPQQDSPALR
jgi:hypothetical protein